MMVWVEKPPTADGDPRERLRRALGGDGQLAFQEVGYSATFLRVDTKQHYVPHAHSASTCFAIDMAAPDVARR